MNKEELAYEAFIDCLESKLQSFCCPNYSNLFDYFSKDNIWFMDILYATSTACNGDKFEIVSILESMSLYRNQGNELHDIMNMHYIEPLLVIAHDLLTEDELDRYRHSYTSVDIPSIVDGSLKRSL